MRCIGVCALAFVVGCGSSGMGASGDDTGGGDDTTGDAAGSDNPLTPRKVTVTLTNRPMNAATFSFVVAYQDGSAPWQVAPAPTGDTYTFDIHAPSYGIAYTCIGTQAGTTTQQLRTVTSAHFAVGERTELTLDVPARCSDRVAGTPVTLTGTITNRPLGGVLLVGWGDRTAFVGTQSGGFQLTAPSGTHDLFVTHIVPEGNGEYYTDRVWVARDVTLNASTTRQINFSESQATQQFGVVIDPSISVTASTTLYTANGTNGLLVRESTNPSVVALAAAQKKATDIYDESIAVRVQGGALTVTRATSTPGDQVWQSPPVLGAPQTTVVAKTPYPMLQSLWPAYTDADGYIWAAAQPCATNTACRIVWSAYLSPGVTGNMPGYRMPDLAAVEGWKPAFELVSGQQVIGSVTAFTSSAGPGDFPPGIPAAGTDRRFVRADYALTP